jgi:hypothetical protein
MALYDESPAIKELKSALGAVLPSVDLQTIAKVVPGTRHSSGIAMDIMLDMREPREYAIANAVILRPLPYADPDRLVSLWDTNVPRSVTHEPLSPVNFMDDRALPVFTDAAAWHTDAVRPEGTKEVRSWLLVL